MGIRSVPIIHQTPPLSLTTGRSSSLSLLLLLPSPHEHRIQYACSDRLDVQAAAPGRRRRTRQCVRHVDFGMQNRAIEKTRRLAAKIRLGLAGDMRTQEKQLHFHRPWSLQHRTKKRKRALTPPPRHLSPYLPEPQPEPGSHHPLRYLPASASRDPRSRPQHRDRVGSGKVCIVSSPVVPVRPCACVRACASPVVYTPVAHDPSNLEVRQDKKTLNGLNPALEHVAQPPCEIGT